MHTFIGKKESCVMFTNGDLEGSKLIINVPTTQCEGGATDSAQIEIEADDVIELVVEHFKSKLIGEIENMDVKDIIKLLR